ncbi:cytochrome P450 monooxygenase pc-2 [Kwoniella heveanensis CBS 569]|nr:cytochrome P450 monooxygenase pc-2 [Kwoniella heveanensis CBS 569]
MKGSQFLVPALLKTVVLPPLLVSCILKAIPLRVPLALGITAYLVSFPLLFILRSHSVAIQSTRHARSLGAVDIPRVHGRWPLNLDVLADWAKSGSDEEVGRMMVLLGRKYGKTYNTRVLGEDQIISSDPTVLKHVLVDDFDNFVKGAKFKDRAEAFLGDGIFNSDGDRWKFHRALMRPFFHPSHISPSLFAPHINAFLDSLPTSSGAAFDVQAKLGQLALEMAIKWMTGEDMSSDPVDYSKVGAEWREACEGLGGAMTEAQKIVGKRVKIGTLWPLFELTHDPLTKPMSIIRSFFRPIIDRAMERKAARAELEELPDEKEDLRFIDRLVEATHDRKLVEDQLINVLLASRDTLASCLTFCIYVLGLEPKMSANLRSEVRAVAAQGDITKDSIRELRYGRAFINEVLRLFPPVPLNIRRTLRPSLLPTSSGQMMYMPGNTSIILAFVLMQRDKTVWGDDAEVFDPSRWMGEGLDKKEREGFMSWNYGPRMCLGQPFALTVTNTFLILLCRHLDRIHQEHGLSLQIAFDAQPAGTGLPEAWKTAEGSDGRARTGRDRMWVVADVVLAIRVSAGLTECQ